MSQKVEITIRKRPREDAVITQRKFFRKTARGKVIKGLQLFHSLYNSLVYKEKQYCVKGTYVMMSRAEYTVAENAHRPRHPLLQRYLPPAH